MSVNVLCNLIFALPFPPDEIFVKLMTWASYIGSGISFTAVVTVTVPKPFC